MRRLASTKPLKMRSMTTNRCSVPKVGGISKILQSCIALTIATAAPPALAIFDQTDDLEDKVVVAAGEIEWLQCPISGKYNCASWPTNLYRFVRKNICVEAPQVTCGFRCKAILAVGKDSSKGLYVFETMGSGLSKSQFEVYRCPDMY